MTAPLAVITGASSGIGRGAARSLARSGWRIVLVARDRKALGAAAAEVVAAGGSAVVEALDASDPELVEELARRVCERDGVPDVIINSAGFGEWRFIEELPASAGRRMMGAPYLAAYHTTAAFMAPMLAAGRGSFVHVGSPASLMPWPGATAYVGARWALRGLHEALVQDLAGTPLQSSHVVLGEVRSAYFERAEASHERIPGIARFIPVMSTDQAGEIVAAVARAPRRQVVRPAMLLVFAWTHRVAPWLVEALVRWTGARRSTDR